MSDALVIWFFYCEREKKSILINGKLQKNIFGIENF